MVQQRILTTGSGFTESRAKILDAARRNKAYRRVVFTGVRTQVVLMSIAAGDVGEEEHAAVESPPRSARRQRALNDA